MRALVTVLLDVCSLDLCQISRQAQHFVHLTLTHTLTLTLSHSLTHSPTRLTHSLPHSLTHSLTQSFLLLTRI